MSYVQLNLTGQSGKQTFGGTGGDSYISYIREVWYGQRSLGETYWLWGWLVVGTVIGGAGKFLFLMLAETLRNPFPLYLYFALLLPVVVWYNVGLWRSATNNPSGWATLVKVLYVIQVPLALVSWLGILMNALKFQGLS
jgi:hypothetical protein